MANPGISDEAKVIAESLAAAVADADRAHAKHGAMSDKAKASSHLFDTLKSVEHFQSADVANTKTSLEGARTALSASLKALRVAREAAERHVANVTGPAVNAALSEVAAAQRVLRQKSETLERAAIHGLLSCRF